MLHDRATIPRSLRLLYHFRAGCGCSAPDLLTTTGDPELFGCRKKLNEIIKDSTQCQLVGEPDLWSTKSIRDLRGRKTTETYYGVSEFSIPSIRAPAVPLWFHT